MSKPMHMFEPFRVPEKRGNHHLSFHDGKIIFQSRDGGQCHAEISFGALQGAYEGQYPDGSFREALYHSLSQSFLPLPLDAGHHSMAQQLRENHVYTQHRTEDD